MAYWFGRLSLVGICFIKLLCWNVCWLAGSWMPDSCHFWNLFSGLWCPWVSFGMLGASTLASWRTLGRYWDGPGTILGHWRAQGRTLWGPGLDFVDFLMILGTHSESFLTIFGPKNRFFHIYFQVAFSVGFWVWIWVSGIGKTSIWHGRYCKNQLL